MSIRSRLKKIINYFFGRTLADFKELSEIDAQRGIHFVQDDHSGKVFIRRELKEYDLATYKYLKKRPVPHTPKIRFLEESEGNLFLIEHVMAGESLEFALQKNGVMDENKVADIVSQLSVIISDFHSCKPAIVNHDLNPGNIKLSVNGVVNLLETNMEKYSRPNAKITDLPAAERYAPPEKDDPNASGVLADIYAMGVLMNVLLTGKHPDELLAEGRLSDVIRRCTALNPAERYQSAAELREELTAIRRSLPFKQRLSSWNRYLLPGFRSRNAYVTFFAALAYIMLIYICLFLNFAGAGIVGMLSRIVFFLAVLVFVLFDGNYLEVHGKLPLTRSRRRFFRWIGILLYNAILLLIFYGLLQGIAAIF